MTDSNILLKIKDTKVNLKFDKDNNFKILVGGRGKFSYLSELDGFKAGRLHELDSVYEKYKKLNREDTFIRLGFSHRSEESVANFAGKVSDIEKRGDGKFVVKGSVYDDVSDKPGKFDLSEVLGSKFTQKHNDFQPFEGEFKIDDEHSSIFLDTFSLRELKDLDVQSFINQSIELNDSELSRSFRIMNNSEDQYLSANESSEKFSFDLVKIDEEILAENSPASVKLKANINPFVDARLNTPNSFWSYIYPSNYSIDFTIGTSWYGGIIVDTGGEDGRLNINFGKLKYEGPKLTKPGLLSAQLKTGVDINSNLKIRGFPAEPFEISASQKYEFNYNLSTRGVTKSDNSDEEVITKFSGFDEVTGFGSLTTVEPYLALEVGIFSPDLPLIGRQNLASVEGKLSIPVDFELDYDKLGGFGAHIDVKGEYEATVKALQILGSSGIEQRLAEGTFFEWQSDNLLA